MYIVPLKNLGINIEPWNKQTNLAGDLIFSSKVLYTDANIKNEKVFAEFGELEHVINNPSESVEYWFFLQPGTKIHAAADGIVHVSYIEHTKDWGINWEEFIGKDVYKQEDWVAPGCLMDKIIER